MSPGAGTSGTRPSVTCSTWPITAILMARDYAISFTTPHSAPSHRELDPERREHSVEGLDRRVTDAALELDENARAHPHEPRVFGLGQASSGSWQSRSPAGAGSWSAKCSRSSPSDGSRSRGSATKNTSR